MLFVASEILLAKEKQTFYKDKISKALKSPAPYKHLKRQAAVMWKKLGKQGEGFWKKHPNPTRFGNAKAPEQQWDSPRRVNLKFFCRCGSSHWMRPGVIIWNVIKQIFASYTSTVTGVCSCPTDVGLALGNEMLMNVAWTEVVGHALLDQRYLHKNNSPYSLPYPQFLLLGSQTNIHRANPHPSGTRSWAFQLSWTQLAARSMHICINASCNRSLSSGGDLLRSISVQYWLIDMTGISKGKSYHLMGTGSSMKKQSHSQVWLWEEVRSNRKQEKSWPQAHCLYLHG